MDSPEPRIPRPRIAITYCRQCNWMLRAGWMAQELLSSFAEDIGEVALLPGTGGVFRIEVDGETVWERKADGGFPDARPSSSASATGWRPGATSGMSTADGGRRHPVCIGSSGSVTHSDSELS